MNEVHETSWVPGIAVLAASLLLAMMYVLFSKAAPSAAKSGKTDEDLEERYRALLAQLKEHAGARHLLPPEAWAEEQHRLEQAAAAVLKERSHGAGGSSASTASLEAAQKDWQDKLAAHRASKGQMPDNVFTTMEQALLLAVKSSTDELRKAKHDALKTQARAEKKQQAVAASPPGNPALKWAFAGGGVVLFFVLLGVLLTRESKPREEGRGMTGVDPNAAAGRPNAPMGEDPRMATLKARVERSPDDVDALADAAAEYVKHQQFDEAYPLVARASGIDPFHVKTRINRAVLEAVGGAPGQGVLDELIHVADTYDGAYDARLYAGSLALELQQTPVAIAQFERYLAESPVSEQPPMIRRTVQMMKAQQSGQSPRSP